MDLKARAIGDAGSRLIFVLAAVGLVLLIACANAVNLLIARGLHRRRELAIRGALGASRGRLLQYVFVEAGLLAAGAAIVGLGIAAGALRLITFYGGPTSRASPRSASWAPRSPHWPSSRSRAPS